ncbi:MAG TPA: universal stress protein [Methanocella sp.]|nr:universal stress protein [Methanocella sp.]
MTSDVKYSRILVPTDGSEYSFIAARHAAYLAKCLGSELIILNVVDSGLAFHSGIHYAEGIASMERSGRDAVGRVEALCRESDVAAVRGVILRGDPKTTILNQAEEEKVDLIVMGSVGMSAIERVLIGSISQSVMHHAKCPVLLIKGR